jgi:hypothetical protein
VVGRHDAARWKPAFVQPGVDRSFGQSHFRRQLGNRALPFGAIGDSAWATKTVGQNADLVQHRPDAALGEGAAARAPPAFGVESACDRGRACAIVMQRFETRDELAVTRQLRKAPNGANNLMLGLTTTGPMTLDGEVFRRSLDRDHHAFQQQAHDLLALGRLCRCRMPQRWCCGRRDAPFHRMVQRLGAGS